MSTGRDDPFFPCRDYSGIDPDVLAILPPNRREELESILAERIDLDGEEDTEEYRFVQIHEGLRQRRQDLESRCPHVVITHSEPGTGMTIKECRVCGRIWP